MKVQYLVAVASLTAMWSAGCGTEAQLFNETFRNSVSGDVVPLAPGEDSGFVFVRLVNDTQNAIEFVVTAERQVLVPDETGQFTIERRNETVFLRTIPAQTANEIGALFDCEVTRVGLGEDIDQITSSPGLFVVEGTDFGVGAGFGVPPNTPPLDSTAGNFGCGDTIVYQAIQSQGQVANIRIQSFVLPWVTQPTEFVGPHTFNNARIFLEEQVREDG